MRYSRKALQRDGYVLAPWGMELDFKGLLQTALTSDNIRTREGSAKVLAAAKSVRASFFVLYGAREVHGNPPGIMIPRHVSDAYTFCFTLKGHVEIGSGAINMHHRDPIVAARKAHQDPSFAGALETAYALGGTRAVRELLGVRFSDEGTCPECNAKLAVGGDNRKCFRCGFAGKDPVQAPEPAP